MPGEQKEKVTHTSVAEKTVINFYMYVSIGFSAYITLTGY